MGTVVSRLSWVEWDAGIAIAARATRSFAQSAIAVLIAIYLGLHGFSLGQVGAFLTLTFRTLFRTFEAILEEPPAERGAGATYRLLPAL
jgi:hypothetical protein